MGILFRKVRKGSSMYKRIHGNLGPFVPPPVRQGSGKLTRFACSNNAFTLSAMLTKGPKLPNECLLYMEEPFLLYWICHIKMPYLSIIPLLYENCLLVCSYIFYCQ